MDELRASIGTKGPKTLADTKVSNAELKSLHNRNATSWRIATPEFDSDLLSVMAQVRKEHGLKPESRIIVFRSPGISAAYNSKSDSFFISESLLQKLDAPGELKVVLSHEVQHQKQRWFTKFANFTSIVSGLAATIYIGEKASKLLGSLAYSVATAASNDKVSDRAKQMGDLFRDSSLVQLGMYALSYTAVEKLWKIPNAAIQRAKERQADRVAVELTGEGEALSTALAKIKQHAASVRKERQKPIAATDADKKDWVIKNQPKQQKNRPISSAYKNLLSKHPNNEERKSLAEKTMKSREAERAAIRQV